MLQSSEPRTVSSGGERRRTTDINYVVVRQGKNGKGRFFGAVLGTVGKNRLVKAFQNSVKAVEGREQPAKASPA
jgi:hypothetical protein